MWRLNPFNSSSKDDPSQFRLENRTVESGQLKLSVKTLIAEGGFASVYCARDIGNGKNYAVKHVIVNDEETLDLTVREIQVMKGLKGHPNVVTLISSAVSEAGRFKEAVLVMELCGKSLAGALNEGLGFWDEKEVIRVFRDVCNAVFALHSQSPPIAHRDLKAENILLGSDGAWKLCDFGSARTNHKRFDKPDEMGIEEDLIRKHTTPAYRAPEMWDLYRKEVISEKVDIWALGCLLYRICYLKSAFDGESKLQILNGNYKIPEQPKYSNEIIGLIKDLLQNSPNDRPDITQVWFRVNALLPSDLQKKFPDGGSVEGLKRSSPAVPKRTPPPLPLPKDQNTPTGAGAFWSTHNSSQNSPKPKQNSPSPKTTLKPSTSTNSLLPPAKLSPPPVRKSASSGNTPQFAANFQNTPPQFSTNSQNPPQFSANSQNPPQFSANSQNRPQFSANFQNPPQFAANFEKAPPQFAANFEKAPPQFVANFEKGTELERELGELREELRRANLEKSEVLVKCEKLEAICKSQKNELQKLRRVLAGNGTVPVPVPVVKSAQKKDEIKGTVWELEQGMISSSASSADRTGTDNSDNWYAFTEPKFDQTLTQSKPPAQLNDLWGFGTLGTGTGTAKTPPGWAGF